MDTKGSTSNFSPTSSIKKHIWSLMPHEWRIAYKFLKLKKEFGSFANRMDTYPGRNADVFFVSYPKSGRTWVRFILTTYIEKLYDQTVDIERIYEFTEQNADTPSIFFTHDGSSLNPINLSSTKILDDKGLYTNGKKSILLVRDPRDVVCSYFYHATSRKGAFHSSISEFIRNDKWGVNKIIRFLNSWAPEIGGHNLLMCRYEDIKSDDVKKLIEIVTFIGLPLYNELLVKVVESARFNNLKKLVTKTGDMAGILKPTNSDPNSAKVRKGQIGGWKNELNNRDCKYLNQAIKKLDPVFGYSEES